ncbi:MAG: hypothetical protein SFU56_15505 [Capsulimonadales bacterium]|nr:hypothetical protein [Capsulimonadales bacterium]
MLSLTKWLPEGVRRRPGLVRNVGTLSRIALSVAAVLTVLSVPYRLTQQALTPAKPSYSFRKVSLSGYANSAVYTTNLKGNAIGTAWNKPDDGFHPFLWRGGQAVELETPAGAQDTIALAINDNDEIAGAALMADESVVGVVWRGQKVFSTITIEGHDVFPHGINNAGQVVGTHSEPG